MGIPSLRASVILCFSSLLALGACFRGDMTYYHPSVGLTACGTYHNDNEFIAALSFEYFGNAPNPNTSPSCQKCALIKSGSGGDVKVQIKDKCAACQGGDIGVSPTAFAKIAPLSVGSLRVSWEFIPCGTSGREYVSEHKASSRAMTTATSSRFTASTSVIGYYAQTWRTTPGLSGATMSVAFSGWTDPTNALRDSNAVYASLKGEKYISFGGGNSNGRFSATGLSHINNAINDGLLSGYDGLVYDVEEGDTGLSHAFQESFRLAKSKGFKVMVTVSHSAPYGFGDAAALMNSFMESHSIDYLSPQLYTTGWETSNDFSITAGYGWDNYKKSNARIVMSIVRAHMYGSAVGYFNRAGITLHGYVQWAQ